MKFLVDENVGLSVVKYLRSQGYNVSFGGEDSAGIQDKEVLEKANREKRIIITNDKDFGDLIFYRSFPHKGVILLRLQDESAKNKIQVIDRLFRHYKDQLRENFIVVTEEKVRIRR